MEYAKRLRRLRQAMARSGWEALLVTHLPDVRYLCGFTGSNGVIAVTARRAVLFTDGRYTAQAKEEVQSAASGFRIVIGKQAIREASELLYGLGLEAVHYDPDHITVAELGRMQASLGSHSGQPLTAAARRRYFQPAAPYPVTALREIKDEDELAHMEAAAALGCQLFEAILPRLQSGTPERDIAAELEYSARRLGAHCMSFATIVASGLRSSLPHGQATAQPLPRKGFVTLDFGVNLDGYCSDMTRTVYMGRPSREEAAAYDAVLEAQQVGVAAIRAGAVAGEIDDAARRVLRRAGLAQYFLHSTGHGVGLEIHEGPRLAAKQEQALAAGMVVTIEPGVYLPGRFGIRIEDMVAVTPDGGRVLTPTTKALMRL
jgi:Xaa-Pro aminopeptidase